MLEIKHMPSAVIFKDEWNRTISLIIAVLTSDYYGVGWYQSNNIPVLYP
jgi:hypothetical protein